MIKGWSEGLGLMVVGEKRRFWIPPQLAYGDNPQRGNPGGMLIFDVELLGFKAPVKVVAPADVGEAPKHAMRTSSGLAYTILESGTEVAQPTATSTVTVHYSGWTTDGALFDSSVARGQPTTFALNMVIPGWTEGLQLMNVGSKFRFWIPAHLAYGDSPERDGAPAGDLVFDVELLKIGTASPGR